MPKAAQQKVALTKELIFSAQIVSLPFIRNHAFARNDTKGAVFRAFPAFLKPFLEMPKKENCKFEHRKCSFVFQSCIHKQFCSLGRGFFFDYSEGDVGG